MGGLSCYADPEGNSELDTLTAIRNRFWNSSPLRHRYKQLLALHNEMLSKTPFLSNKQLHINNIHLTPETFINTANADLYKIFAQTGQKFEEAVNAIY